jgi:hypothetical protein
MTLSAPYARLRASLGFNGFKAGGVDHRTEAHQTLDDLRRLRSTLPPFKLRNAEANAKLQLDNARKAIRRWELEEQIKRAKAEHLIVRGGHHTRGS